jgi:hypothetical protein
LHLHRQDDVEALGGGWLERMMEVRCSGAWLATCSDVKPPYEMPIVLTWPVHHSSLDRVHTDLLLLRQVLVGAHTGRRASAADVDAGDGVALLRQLLVEARAGNDLVLPVLGCTP